MAHVNNVPELLGLYAAGERAFWGSSLKDAQLSGKKLSDSILSYSVLVNADLNNADLSNADFTHANLTGAKFNGAILKGAKFTNAMLNGADFKGAKLDGVIFSDTPAPVLASGQFQVPSNVETGVTFTNPINAEITIVFTPSGTWSACGTGLQCTPGGIVGYGLQYNCLYPSYFTGALLAVNKVSGAVTTVEGQKRMRMKPNETLTFLMNDGRNCFADNWGSLTVSWAALATS